MDNIIINNADILFRNFEGKGSRYNAEGNRNFCVIIDDDVAANLMNEGWNIKILKPRDEDDTAKYYTQVKVSYAYDRFAPKVYLVTRKGKTLLDEDDIAQLDYADIKSVDLEIRPRVWEDDNGKEHIKAYLKTGYFVLEEDPFAEKYRDDDNEDELPWK